MKISKIEKDENADTSYRSTPRWVITPYIPVYVHKIALAQHSVRIYHS